MSASEPTEQSVLLLLQYSYSHMSDAQVEVDESCEELLKNALHDFILGKQSFEDTKNLFMEKAKTDVPVQIAYSIMNVSDTPIEQPEENDEGQEESPPVRRKTRTWTGYEDQRLVAGIFRYGFDSWIRVANFVGGGRTRAQCAQRWTRGLNPKICKKGWTPEEDQQLLNYVRIYGNKSWAKIANLLGNRSDVQCRYHYLQLTNEMKPSNNNFIPLGRSQRFMTTSGFIPPGLMNPILPPDPVAISSLTTFPTHLFTPELSSTPQLTTLPVSVPLQAIPQQQIQPQTMYIQTTAPVVQQPMAPAPMPTAIANGVHCWDFGKNQPSSLDSFLNQMNKPR